MTNPGIAIDLLASRSFQPKVLIFPSSWLASVPRSGTVTCPNSLDALSPGQRISIGCRTNSHALEDIKLYRLNLLLKYGNDVKEWKEIRPITVRKIRSPGLDHVLNFLNKKVL